MRIRLATIDDIGILAEYDKHISKSELEHIVPLHRVFVAEENGKLIGWLRYGLFWDSIPFMNMVYLLPDSRGCGFGKQLVQFWENEMQRQSYNLVMTSTVSEEYAQHFYHKLGYAAIGGFLLDQDPFEVILSKKL